MKKSDFTPAQNVMIEKFMNKYAATIVNVRAHLNEFFAFDRGDISAAQMYDATGIKQFSYAKVGEWQAEALRLYNVVISQGVQPLFGKSAEWNRLGALIALLREQNALVSDEEIEAAYAVGQETSITTAFESFMADSAAVEEAIESGTAAAESASIELFHDGTYRVLWSGNIGNLYRSDGIIVSIPTLRDDERGFWLEEYDMESPPFYDNAIDELRRNFEYAISLMES